MSGAQMPETENRSLVIASASLFATSCAFPVAASLLRHPAPRWMGLLDVALAVVLVVAATAIVAKAPAFPSARATDSSFAAYRNGSALFLVLLVAFFLWGERIRWSILLPGLAWRAWLLVWVLPSALGLWRDEA